MSKHTPGPWSFQSGASNQVHVIFGADGKYIGREDSFPVRPLEEGEANARLIKAAPELLEAAIDIVRRVDLDHAEPVEFAGCVFDDLRAAIASATGN